MKPRSLKMGLSALSLMSVLGCDSSETSARNAQESAHPLEGGRDLAITRLSAPPSVSPGRPLELTVTVCNPGTESAYGQGRLFLSSDTVFSADTDVQAGTFSLNNILEPGQCTPQRVTVPSWNLPEGLWYVGARLEGPGDQNPANDTAFSAPVGIGYQADFIVSSVKGPASVLPGQSLTAQVTVCNQGTRDGWARVALILSENESIQFPPKSGPAEDSLLAEALLPMLSAGGCATLPLSGTVVLPPGSAPSTRAFQLGALVDPDNMHAEFREDNNSHPGYLMGVGEGPDFILTSVKGPPSVRFGQPLGAQVTVCNQGTRLGGTDVALRLSNPSAPASDTLVGRAPTGPLAPGQCTPLAISGPATPPMPDSPSTRAFQLAALVDPDNTQPELIESNNRHAGYLLGVGDGADFIVTSVTGPASVQSGASFSAQVTVCNQGTAPGITSVGVGLFDEPDIRLPLPQGTIVGRQHTTPIAPGQCTSVSVFGAAYRPGPWSMRPYYLGAVVDENNSTPELIESNNTHPGYLLGVGDGADFIVSAVKGPVSVMPGQTFTTQVTVCNQGTQPGSTRVALLISEDEVLRAPSPSSYMSEDGLVAHAPTPPLNPGQCAPVSLSGQASPPPRSEPSARAFHLGAVVDPDNTTQELREDNNAHLGYVLGLGSEPDFIVTAVKGPTSARSGQTVTAQVTVCNQGTQPGSTRVALVLSEDAVIQPPLPSGPSGPSGPSDDRLVGSAQFNMLAAGQCTTLSVSGPAEPPARSAPTPRAFHLGAFVDPDNMRPELREDNNAHPGYLLGVGEGADFVVTAVKGPPSARYDISAQVTVCNQGTQPGSTRVALVLSEDENIQVPVPSGSGPDILVASAPVNQLAPQQCATIPLSGFLSGSSPYPSSTRAFHLGAAVDPENTTLELREDNNTHVGYLLGLGEGADFVITALTGPSSVGMGQPLTTQVTVCNQGTATAGTSVALILSEDENLVLPTHNASEDRLVAATQVGPLAPAQCTTLTLSGSAQPPPRSRPPTRAFHLGALVNPDHATPELREDNNAHAGYVLLMGDDADFVVTSVESPVIARVGQSLTTQVTVCNQGTQPGSTRVSVLLSLDTTLRARSPAGSPEDHLVGEAPTGYLQPGWCETVSITGYASVPPMSSPEPATLLYVGAVVNAEGMNPELSTDNNSLLGGWIYLTN